MSNWLRKGDKVLVIAGNDKGKTGTVVACGLDKILVQGVNVRKKHVKKRSDKDKGGIFDIETPIHISNVAPCTADGKKVKLQSKVTEKGEKILFYVEDGNEVVFRTLRKNKKSR